VKPWAEQASGAEAAVVAQAAIRVPAILDIGPATTSVPRRWRRSLACPRPAPLVSAMAASTSRRPAARSRARRCSCRSLSRSTRRGPGCAPAISRRVTRCWRRRRLHAGWRWCPSIWRRGWPVPDPIPVPRQVLDRVDARLTAIRHRAAGARPVRARVSQPRRQPCGGRVAVRAVSRPKAPRVLALSSTAGVVAPCPRRPAAAPPRHAGGGRGRALLRAALCRPPAGPPSVPGVGGQGIAGRQPRFSCCPHPG
jgi:hypothetical protein